MGWLLAGREATQGGDDKMSKRIKKKTHIKPISKKKKNDDSICLLMDIGRKREESPRF